MTDTIRITLPEGETRNGRLAGGDPESRLAIMLDNAAPLPRIGQRVKLELGEGEDLWFRTVTLQGDARGILCEFESMSANRRRDPAAGLAALEAEVMSGKKRPRSRLVPSLAVLALTLGFVFWQRPDLREKVMAATKNFTSSAPLALADAEVPAAELGEGWTRSVDSSIADLDAAEKRADGGDTALVAAARGQGVRAFANYTYEHAGGARLAVQLHLFQDTSKLDAVWQAFAGAGSTLAPLEGLGDAALAPADTSMGTPTLSLRRGDARVTITALSGDFADARRLAELFDAALK